MKHSICFYLVKKCQQLKSFDLVLIHRSRAEEYELEKTTNLKISRHGKIVHITDFKSLEKIGYFVRSKI